MRVQLDYTNCSLIYYLVICKNSFRYETKNDFTNWDCVYRLMYRYIATFGAPLYCVVCCVLCNAGMQSMTWLSISWPK